MRAPAATGRQNSGVRPLRQENKLLIPASVLTGAITALRLVCREEKVQPSRRTASGPVPTTSGAQRKLAEPIGPAKFEQGGFTSRRRRS